MRSSARRSLRMVSTAVAPALISLDGVSVTVGGTDVHDRHRKRSSNLKPRTLVSDLNLSIREGERWAILGVNGVRRCLHLVSVLDLLSFS